MMFPFSAPAQLGFGYQPKLSRHTQKRLSGRMVLAPSIDLDRYRVKAVVDWVQFKLILPSPSQFQHVKRVVDGPAGASLWVEAIPDRRAPSATEFSIKLHDPTSERIVAIQEAASTAWEGSALAPLAMEVSVDFYPKDASEEARRLIHGIVQRHFFPEPARRSEYLDYPRIISWQNKEQDGRRKGRKEASARGDLCSRGQMDTASCRRWARCTSAGRAAR